MSVFLEIGALTLPLTNPVVKFLIILIIILSAPLLLNKIKIPHLLGLIIAGAIIGPYGVNLIERDSGMILSGTAGLLYIMFLAGLEIDLAKFRKNSVRSFIFGMYTFLIPMILGALVSLYVLNFSVLTSILLASMFASHTLIAYPIISKMGVSKNRAVNVALGGTLITDTLALLVLAVIVGMTNGEVDNQFWIKLSISIFIFASIILFLFPIIGRWFLKHVNDNVSQYIFVLVMVFLGAVLAELAGIEGIIGAFLSGLALNRLIPSTSPLMNRVEFVGNAIFIPFFLIGVGMLINFEAFIKDEETIKVAIVMTIVATLAKFLAALAAQKSFRYTADERRLIFGLSNAQAAATLAAVLIGYNIILGQTSSGEPIRLLNESILNGTILMILVTCTIASFAAQKGAKNVALYNSHPESHAEKGIRPKILIPVEQEEIIEEMVNLGITIKPKKTSVDLFGLSVLESDNLDSNSEKDAQRKLNKAAKVASATDNHLLELLRYDSSKINGIINVVKEHKITDLILSLGSTEELSDPWHLDFMTAVLDRCNVTTLLFRPTQPLATIKRHLIIVPEKAEKEIGFPFWIIKMWNIAQNTGAQLLFYATPITLKYIKDLHKKHPIECQFVAISEWEDFLLAANDIRPNDNLIVIMSRKDNISYNKNMSKIPANLSKYFKSTSYIIIYPIQTFVAGNYAIDLMNPSIMEPIERIDEIGRTLGRLLRRK